MSNISKKILPELKNDSLKKIIKGENGMELSDVGLFQKIWINGKKTG